MACKLSGYGELYSPLANSRLVPKSSNIFFCRIVGKSWRLGVPDVARGFLDILSMSDTFHNLRLMGILLMRGQMVVCDSAAEL